MSKLPKIRNLLKSSSYLTKLPPNVQSRAALIPKKLQFPKVAHNTSVIVPDRLFSHLEYSMHHKFQSFQRCVHHNDVEPPNFENSFKKSVSDPNQRSRDSQDGRQLVTYIVLLGAGMGSMYAAKSEVTHFVSTMAPSAEVLALARIEIKMSDIPVGKNATFKWRGKPLFVWHRAPEDIAGAKSVPLNILRDPQSDEDRTKDPEWLVLIGVCTHLGCVPIFGAGDYGGFYCPCHGSQFDASGRIRKGPAPTNLEVPFYEIAAGTLLVG